MRTAAREAFVPFSEPLEGACTWLYCDAAKLISTGLGHLCNTFAEVAILPWKRPDGTLATRDEVAAAYAAVRAREDWHLRGGGVYAKLTTIRLSHEDVLGIAARKLESNEFLLRRRFPDYDDWPADAQLFIHSWAWAVGPAAGYPMMSAALRRGDFADAARECAVYLIREKTDPETGQVVVDPETGKPVLERLEIGTLRERNDRNRLLLTNAQRVRDHHLDPERLYWPVDVKELVQAAETVPELPVSEADGGQSRRDATSDAVHECAERRGE